MPRRISPAGLLFASRSQDLVLQIVPGVRVEAVTRRRDRAKRVGVSIDKIDHGKRRPCCFDLSSCTDPDVARSGKLPEPS